MDGDFVNKETVNSWPVDMNEWETIPKIKVNKNTKIILYFEENPFNLIFIKFYIIL